MRLPQNRGSVGIPEIQLYHKTAQLANILCILTMELKTDWMTMEFDNLEGMSANEILWMPNRKSPLTIEDNTYCAATLKIWDK